MQVVSEYVTDFEFLLLGQMSITAYVELPYKFVVDNPAKLEIGNRYIGNPGKARDRKQEHRKPIPGFFSARPLSGPVT